MTCTRSLVRASLVCLLLTACATTPTPDADPGDPANPETGLSARLGKTATPRLNVLTGDTCPPYVQQPLREPVRIYPRGGVLSTELVVASQKRCVPLWNTDTDRWETRVMNLRTYGHPSDLANPLDEDAELRPDSDALTFTAPGPTFVLRKATRPGRNDGTRFRMVLHNLLEPQADPHGCDTLERRPNSQGQRAQGPFPNAGTPPNCFHGDNSTNFHFHGFHVSPQPHQDYVGLELLPYGATAPAHAVHARGEVAVGSYRYDLDPLRHTQAEGTHWYHAHKHGSTALQVLNGLVGTFEIRGAFDEELARLFVRQGGLKERLLVVQQLQENPTGMAGEPPGPPAPLVNGMADPIVRMRPGEIQRWRFVSATMMAAAKLEIGFGDTPDPRYRPKVRQIAMDGVQFAPENYACQPILYGPDCEDGTEDDSFQKLNGFLLDPGTRADFLVKAPVDPGRYAVTFRIAEELGEDAEPMVTELEDDLRNRAQGTSFSSQVSDPLLLTLEVISAPPSQARFPAPKDFPRMPGYLDDIPTPSVVRTVGYEMAEQGVLDQVKFTICGEPYDPACVNETLTLGVAEEWTLTNNSGIAHPFHIHTNPFQLVSDASGTYKRPYVWRDTVAIPDGTPTDLGRAVVRYHPTEFTGEFVNHCHILGHEDRGMMHNVQVRCENGRWGLPTDDLSPECRDGNYTDAAPECTEGVCAASRR